MLKAGQGDASAYRELQNVYLARVVNYAHRLLQDSAEAEDVTQTAFLRLWQTAPKWEPQAKVSTWLFRVVHNLSLDRLRATQRFSESDAGGEGELEKATESQRPSALLERRELAEGVQRAVASLPERQRAALMLSHQDGLGNGEIGQVLGLHVEAVESLLARARRRLRELLAVHREGMRT
jgi:RNA polymerase sigma-70 factor, ECF subfamily